MTEFWHDRTVLVTGAGGFIGSHLVEVLVESGARVRAFVRYNSRNDPGLLRMLPQAVFERLEVLAGDLRDLDAVKNAVVGQELVFHLGALIAIPYSYLRPAEVVTTNVIGTLNVLLAGRDSGVRRIVHTSTSEVYGTALRVPIDECHPLQGQSPYSASKIGADKLAESFYRAFDVPVVTLRPFNTYGPRQSARAVIPTIIAQALTRDTVYLGNLAARRDLTYISDTVASFLRAAQAEGVDGQEFNLGTGTQVTIADLAAQIIALIDRDVQVVIDPERLRPKKSEVECLLADNARAGKALGWQPQVELREGLERTIAWMREHLDLYKPNVYTI